MQTPSGAAANSTAPDLLGRTLAGKFRVDSVVARGGFGVLYRGTHLTLSRPVAIKVLQPPARLDALAREAMREAFEQEARVIARLTHPAIVTVLEFGVEESDPTGGPPLLWMALEWLEGKPLSAVLHARRGERYTPEEALALVRPVLQALAYAHDEGVAHRDLKPANIMAVPVRRGLALKLIDFGIAKAMDEDESVGTGETRTQSVLAMYSPKYAAPEQLGRARTGPWTDVHAMALILTEMLIGHPAYTSHSSDPTGLFAEVLHPQRPTPGRFGVDVGNWEIVLRKALAVRSNERQAHAGQLLEELERADASPRPVRDQPSADTHPQGSQAPIGSSANVVSLDAPGAVHAPAPAFAPSSEAHAPLDDARSGVSTGTMTGGLPLPGAPRGRPTALIVAGALIAMVCIGGVGWWLGSSAHARAGSVAPPTPPVARAAIAAPAPPPVAPTANAPPVAPVVPGPPIAAPAPPPEPSAPTPSTPRSSASRSPRPPRSHAPSHRPAAHSTSPGSSGGAPEPPASQGLVID